MTALAQAAPWATALLLAVGAALAMLRLWLRRRAAAPQTRGPVWRVVALTALQPLAPGALFLCLFPPGADPGGPASDVLLIATAGAPRGIAAAPGETLVALPEARLPRPTEQAPDLAAALRRHPQARTIRIVGHGLAPRDRAAAVGLAAAFDPAPPPAGFLRLAWPGPTPPGASFLLSGEASPLRGGKVELIDPQGLAAAQAPLPQDGRFRLQGAALAPGLTVFRLRLRDAGGRLVEELAVPIDAAPRAAPRVLLLAGAPGAEIKFLRRWAQDAGVALAVEIEAGGGVRLSDGAPALNAATLAATDMLVLDAARWEGLGAGPRTAVLEAVRAGMGVLLRLNAPPAAETRATLAALGLPLPLPTSPAQPAAAAPAAAPPEPRAALPAPSGPGAVRFAEGSAAWTSLGRGRIGVLTLQDSYVWQLTGRGRTHGALWSQLFTTLARAEPTAALHVAQPARVGARTMICGLMEAGVVAEPGGGSVRLLRDPASGGRRCAGYWPSRPGWRTVESDGRTAHIYVHPAGAAPGLAATEAAEATQALVSSGAARKGQAAAALAASPWFWFGLLCALLAAMWRLERWRRRPPGGVDAPA